MVGEPQLLHSTSALFGAMIVGGASLCAAIYSQWYQGRLQMMTREASKREAIYGEFIMSASKVLVKAYISDNLSWTRNEQHLIALINRMRLFAPPHVIAEAESVIRTLVRISLQPKLELDELARTTLTDRSVPDFLLCFSLATQADLKSVYESSGAKQFRAMSRALAAACMRELHRLLPAEPVVMSKNDPKTRRQEPAERPFQTWH
jgi:hypothetical protein